jgi:outer membrane beta-barrel protein
MQRWLGLFILLCSLGSFAQGPATEQQETLDDSTAKVVPESDKETSEIDSALEESLKKSKNSAEPEVEIKPLPEVKDLSGLGRLSQFEDIAVIQRRYLPKTGRFEFYPNLGFIINDAFFTNTVASGRLGFYFSESYSLELQALILGTQERKITKDLNDNRGVTTRSLVTPQSYYGLDFKWSPVYGKMGSFNSSIVPFDLYFSGGGGMTKTNQGENVFTTHVGTGQIYALAKWAAFRWDLSWYFYSAKATTGSSGTFTNIYAMVGLSFFFPGAKYR